ncbi:hypothetical protein AALP_AA5G182900 [Arabis alpina]|uniref:Uncharacterized protein n=1 Tax=Arabis alpina TaxID=50452 RepID=A0A087GXW5_ARAAL|nr:hypothetical protein AALP_AA5G182900 [Arabis alpina]
MLPAKSISRFRTSCRSNVERQGSWSFFSSPEPSPFSLVVTAEFHSRFSEDVSRSTCSYASGIRV